jgi:hypothetical protein
VLLEDVEFQVTLSEVLAPLTHTMDFINDESLDFVLTVKFLKHVSDWLTPFEFLRCEIDQFDVSLDDLVNHFPSVFVPSQDYCRNTSFHHIRTVVFNEGDERHDHYGHSIFKGSRQLEG